MITPSCQTFLPITEATLSFQPLPGTLASLAPAGDGFVWVEGSWPGVMQLFDGSSYDIFDPSDYLLTFPWRCPTCRGARRPPGDWGRGPNPHLAGG